MTPTQLHAEFDDWWRGMHCEGEETGPYDKQLAWEAFLYGRQLLQHEMSAPVEAMKKLIKNDKIA